jgi:tetratricopeptide (TPR) repeat protein
MRALLAAAVLLLAAAAPDFEHLFAALKAAPGPAAAGAVEEQLLAAWHDQASPSVQILMDQAQGELAAGKAAEALANLDAALVLQPTVADLWRRRAEARSALGSDAGAAADLAQALSREPRLLPALVDLSQFAEGRKNYKEAVAAWERVLALDPKMEKGAARLERLRRKMNGEPI